MKPYSKNRAFIYTSIAFAIWFLIPAQFVLAQSLDRDNDSIEDSLDNCPDVSNQDQIDTDGDGFGNMCDIFLTRFNTAHDARAGVAVNETTNRVYVAGHGPHSITVVDGSDHHVSADIPTGISSRGLMAHNPTSGRTYIAGYDTTGQRDPCQMAFFDDASGTVEYIDLKALTLAIWDPWYFCTSVAVAVNPTTNRIYIRSDEGASLLILDGNNHSYVDWIDISVSRASREDDAGYDEGIIGVNPVTNRIYIVGQMNGEGAIEVIDGSANSMVATIPLGFNVYAPFALAINPVTNRIYVGSSRNFVAVVDGVANQIVDYIDTTSDHGNYILKGIAVDPSTNRIYVAYQSRALIIADGVTNQVVGDHLIPDIDAYGHGGGVMVNSVTNRIYVAGLWKNGHYEVAVLVGATNTTPAGADVAVQPVDAATGTAPLTLTFSSVTWEGQTTLASSSEGPPVPSGFQVGEPAIYYDVNTTATFTGNILLCFSWPEGQFENENTIALFHYENGAWQNVTTSLDTANNKVCGETTSLSPFALFERTPYAFTGFLSPVDNPPIGNVVRAGAAVPVKFSLGGNQGLAVFSSGSPSSQLVACETNVPLSDVEETVMSGGSSLSYDSLFDQYTYVWKTDKAWANTCRRLILKFNEGTVKTAEFKFTK